MEKELAWKTLIRCYTPLHLILTTTLMIIVIVFYCYPVDKYEKGEINGGYAWPGRIDAT